VIFRNSNFEEAMLSLDRLSCEGRHSEISTIRIFKSPKD
jgi:hypothetical protein